MSTTKVSMAFSFMFPKQSVLVTGTALKALVQTGMLMTAVSMMVSGPLLLRINLTVLRGT